jgi:hypothetical protein
MVLILCRKQETCSRLHRFQFNVKRNGELCFLGELRLG